MVKILVGDGRTLLAVIISSKIDRIIMLNCILVFLFLLNLFSQILNHDDDIKSSGSGYEFI